MKQAEVTSSLFTCEGSYVKRVKYIKNYTVKVRQFDTGGIAKNCQKKKKRTRSFTQRHVLLFDKEVCNLRLFFFFISGEFERRQ